MLDALRTRWAPDAPSQGLRIARELAGSVGAEVPATDALAAVMEHLVADGCGDLDQSAVALAYDNFAAGDDQDA